MPFPEAELQHERTNPWGKHEDPEENFNATEQAGAKKLLGNTSFWHRQFPQ
jgi:hypothetical protein